MPCVCHVKYGDLFFELFFVMIFKGQTMRPTTRDFFTKVLVRARDIHVPKLRDGCNPDNLEAGRGYEGEDAQHMFI